MDRYGKQWDGVGKDEGKIINVSRKISRLVARGRRRMIFTWQYQEGSLYEGMKMGMKEVKARVQVRGLRPDAGQNCVTF